MIHITQEGDAAPGNPFIAKTGALPEIYSIGHRSEEGLTVHPVTGQLWEIEHGARGGDELNKIEPGKNYGWPVITHGIDYPGTAVGEGIVQKEGMEQPRYYWDPVIAPSGITFYNGNLFPQWKGNVLVGALRGKMLDRLTLEGDKVVAEEPLLVDMQSRIRDVRVGPEGAVYVITDDGKLLRITPK
jgi:glucose/arabinose dehydrogenase